MLKIFTARARIFLLLFFAYTNILGQQSDILKIPLTSSREFVKNISWTDAYDSNSLLYNSARVYKGIPKGLASYIIKIVDFQPAQTYYELYNRLNGEMTIQNLAIGLKRINFKIEDTIKLSKAPIKHFVSFLVGKKENGNSVIAGDANNDYDFSNDRMCEFDSSMTYESLGKSEYGVDRYNYQYSDNGKVIDRTIDLQVLPTDGGYLKYNDPNEQKHYLVVAPHFLKRGTVNADGSIYKINVFSFPPFNTYRDSNLRLYFYKQHEEQGRYFKSLSDTIVLGKTKYLIEDITLFGDTLSLKKVSNAMPIEFGIEAGNYAYNIFGKDLITSKPIDLSKFRGKYVLVDFWGTWCGPCKAITGELKSLYDQLGNDKVEFLSIAYEDDASLPKKYIKEHQLNWYHLFVNAKLALSNDKELAKSYVQKFKIQGFPTLLLIDPTGKIIAREEGIGEGWQKIREFLKTRLGKPKAKSAIKNTQLKN